LEPMTLEEKPAEAGKGKNGLLGQDLLAGGRSSNRLQFCSGSGEWVYV